MKKCTHVIFRYGLEFKLIDSQTASTLLLNMKSPTIKAKDKVKDNKKKVLFRNSQFLMALQFCSNSLLLKSTVQLFRVITEIKIGREKNKRYHLTYKVEKQKGMRSHTKCTLSSYNFSPRAFCLFTVLRDK